MEVWSCVYKEDVKAKAETLKRIEGAIARKLNNERKKPVNNPQAAAINVADNPKRNKLTLAKSALFKK